MKIVDKRVRAQRIYLFHNDKNGKEFLIRGTDERDAQYNAWLRFDSCTLIREVSDQEYRQSIMALLPMYQ